MLCCRGLQEQDTSAGQRTESHAELEPGVNVEGARTLLHGAEVPSLHAGQSSQVLRQRCVSHTCRSALYPCT